MLSSKGTDPLGRYSKGLKYGANLLSHHLLYGYMVDDTC